MNPIELFFVSFVHPLTGKNGTVIAKGQKETMQKHLEHNKCYRISFFPLTLRDEADVIRIINDAIIDGMYIQMFNDQNFKKSH